MADITTELGAVEMNLPDQIISAGLGILDRLPKRCHTQHPTAARDNLAITHGRTGMEDMSVLELCIQPADDVPFARIIRITASSQDYA